MDQLAEEARLESYWRAWRSVHRRERRERTRERWSRARYLLSAPGLVGAALAGVEVMRPGPTPALVVAGAALLIAWLVTLVDPY